MPRLPVLRAPAPRAGGRPRLDLAGQRFGTLVALAEVGRDRWNNGRWDCACDCGARVVVSRPNLRSGNTRSCGCVGRGRIRKPIDVGTRFGRLVVTGAPARGARGAVSWPCACDCGGTTLAAGYALRAGQKRSCGCLPRCRPAADLAGRVFGSWTVLAQARVPKGRVRFGARNRYWTCACACGAPPRVVRGTLLTSGASTSCGCASAAGRARATAAATTTITNERRTP